MMMYIVLKLEFTKLHKLHIVCSIKNFITISGALNHTYLLHLLHHVKTHTTLAEIWVQAFDATHRLKVIFLICMLGHVGRPKGLAKTCAQLYVNVGQCHAYIYDGSSFWDR